MNDVDGPAASVLDAAAAAEVAEEGSERRG